MKSEASNLMLLAMLMLTLPSICAAITALLLEGDVRCNSWLVKVSRPPLVIVTLVTTPLTTFAVAAACVPDPLSGAPIVNAKSPVYLHHHH